jgi:hypothetical protein
MPHFVSIFFRAVYPSPIAMPLSQVAMRTAAKTGCPEKRAAQEEWGLDFWIPSSSNNGQEFQIDSSLQNHQEYMIVRIIGKNRLFHTPIAA